MPILPDQVSRHVHPDPNRSSTLGPALHPFVLQRKVELLLVLDLAPVGGNREEDGD